MGTISTFIERSFRHFNAAVVMDAARAWHRHLTDGGQMLVSLAGAMSTAEIGITLAELIRRDRVHALTVTGANLEEDLFNLVAHDHYVRIPDYRTLSPGDEADLAERGLNRVTDTCIPEEQALKVVEAELLELWKRAEKAGQRRFPHEFFYELLRSGRMASRYQIDPRDSWLVAAAERELPIWTPGWEDSTCGNLFVAHHLRGHLSRLDTVRSGLEAMNHLVGWYREHQLEKSLGIFQIGGGIAGDFPICAVPLLRQDLKEDVRFWGYFAQISDSTTSYGSYSGAVPNEKITWGKLRPDTPRFIIESDATIVFPLVAALLLDL